MGGPRKENADLVVPAFRRPGPSVQALHDAVVDAVRLGRVGVGLVVQGDVVEDVLVLAVHAAQPVFDDHPELVGEGRVVHLADGDDRGLQQRVTILMLQSFAVKRGTAGSGSDEKTPAAHIRGRPDQIPHPLRTEHRVIGVKGNRINALGGIGGPGGNKRRDRTGLVDPFLEDTVKAFAADLGNTIGVKEFFGKASGHTPLCGELSPALLIGFLRDFFHLRFLRLFEQTILLVLLRFLLNQ